MSLGSELGGVEKIGGMGLIPGIRYYGIFHGIIFHGIFHGKKWGTLDPSRFWRTFRMMASRSVEMVN